MPIRMEDRTEALRRESLCVHFGGGYVPCQANYLCNACVIADRLRAGRAAERTELLLRESDCLRQTPKGGGCDFFGKPIVLRPEAFSRLKLPVRAVDQIVVAYDGPGVFVTNPSGAIDVCSYADPSKRFTVTRRETYGIPTQTACRRLDALFIWDLEAKLYKGGGGDRYDPFRLIRDRMA